MFCGYLFFKLNWLVERCECRFIYPKDPNISIYINFRIELLLYTISRFMCVGDKKTIIYYWSENMVQLLRWYFNNTSKKKTSFHITHTQLTENKIHSHKVCIYISTGDRDRARARARWSKRVWVKKCAFGMSDSFYILLKLISGGVNTDTTPSHDLVTVIFYHTDLWHIY